MNEDQIAELCRRHTLFSWSANAPVNRPVVARAEGVYYWTAKGQRLLDFTSQALSVHIGHSHPRVTAAMKKAADELIFCLSGFATEARARLGQALAEIFPGDLNCFFFATGGADAVESAVRLARLYTGRSKIMSRYRSYHGGTHAALAIGGDPRGQHVEPLPGIVHVMDIEPYEFAFGDTESTKVENYLRYLEEIIRSEGPEQIAAMIVEVIPGTNGVAVPPSGYLSQVADLLRSHGILLICDEVMTGFGRTGKMFAFEHQGVAPDLVAAAKGLTSSYVPLGCVAMRDSIAEHFRDHVYWGGMTYNAHAFALNVAREALAVLIDERMVENSAALGEVLNSRLSKIARHRSVEAVRSIGLFGAIQLSAQQFPTALRTPEATSNDLSKQVVAGLRAKGLSSFIRYNNMLIAPPLCITEEQLNHGLDLIDEALEELDQRIA